VGHRRGLGVGADDGRTQHRLGHAVRLRV
jgi:hypothetical protein